METELLIKRGNPYAKETAGLLTTPGGFKCVTLENNNVIIPVGKYNWIKSGATKNIPYCHILLIDVPNRSGIAIHILNYYYQSRGCIGVGKTILDINNDGNLDILQSKNTHIELMGVTGNKGVLIIK